MISRCVIAMGAWVAAWLGPAAAQTIPTAPGPAGPARFVLLQAGAVLAVPGQPAQREMTVVVKNDRVERLAKGYLDDVPHGAADSVRVVDLKNRFVLPGLMDAHVHLHMQAGDGTRGQSPRRGRAAPLLSDRAVNAVVYGRRTLAAGFTTVRDLGSDEESIFAVRDLFASGRVTGPRILVAGSPISATGGHGDDTTVDGDLFNKRLMNGVCDGPAACMAAVRMQHKLGANVIKVTATGGFSGEQSFESQFTLDELSAIVTAAHQLNLRVAVHAYTPHAIADVVKSGANSVEHGFFVDDATLKEMKRKGVFLVPTLSAAFPPPFLGVKNPPSLKMRDDAKAFERAYAMGVKIAFGTDAGTFNHGENAKEFDLMVGYGMTPMDAIAAATVRTAELFDLSEQIGTLESGKVADVIAVTGNPLDNIAALHTIDFVMKSGVIAKENGEMHDGITYPPFGSDGPRRGR
jgi:imidazolonepropionase-like amidohydrolase